jgi:hypothetical protein
MSEASLDVFEEKDLEEIALLLSKESYRNIQSEMKRMKSAPPKATGIFEDNLNYMPRTFKECQIQNEKLKERYQWSRRLCFLSEIIIVDRNRTIRRLGKENSKLKDENADLKNDIKRLLNQLRKALGIKTDASAHKAPSDPSKDEKATAQKHKRGAPEGHMGKTRPIPDRIDKIKEVLPPEECPKCHGTHIYLCDEFISKYIEDILPIKKVIEEIRYRFGVCSQCSHAVIHPDAFNGPPVKVGDTVISMLTVLRQQMGISYRKLSKLSMEIFHVPLTPSGVLGIMHRVSCKLEPIYKGIETSLRQTPFLHGDETGWRMDGDRWYMWCFCTKKVVYYHADSSRGAKVPKAILGSQYQGILHADFYSAYNFLPQTQRCLIHFLRSIKEELEVSPQEQALLELKTGIKDIIEKGNEIKNLPASPEKSEQKEKLENDLFDLTKLESSNKKVKAFVKRIIRYQKHLLRFVDHPQVEYHNNWVEQILRWVVIFRKLSFGNRSPTGARDFSIMASVLETSRLNGNNLFDFVRVVLRTPTDRLHRITRSLLDTS